MGNKIKIIVPDETRQKGDEMKWNIRQRRQVTACPCNAVRIAVIGSGITCWTAIISDFLYYLLLGIGAGSGALFIGVEAAVFRLVPILIPQNVTDVHPESLVT